MRGERREGRFSIDNERASIIAGTTQELVRTVGNTVDWWIYDPSSTVIDPIYDVGSSDPATGGRQWTGPLILPVVKAVIYQGVTMQNDRGFYNTDLLRITMNIDVIERGTDLVGSNSVTMPHFETFENNPDEFLRDRIVFRDEVFSPTKMYPLGIVKNKYTLWGMDCVQVNPEELVNDEQFRHYANYNPFDPTTV